MDSERPDAGRSLQAAPACEHSEQTAPASSTFCFETRSHEAQTALRPEILLTQPRRGPGCPDSAAERRPRARPPTCTGTATQPVPDRPPHPCLGVPHHPSLPPTRVAGISDAPIPQVHRLRLCSFGTGQRQTQKLFVRTTPSACLPTQLAGPLSGSECTGTQEVTSLTTEPLQGRKRHH